MPFMINIKKEKHKNRSYQNVQLRFPMSKINIKMQSIHKYQPKHVFSLTSTGKHLVRKLLQKQNVLQITTNKYNNITNISLLHVLYNYREQKKKLM